MSHVKASATTKGNRDAKPKNLGIKMFAGEKAISGNILVRQKGTKFRPGTGVDLGSDYTIYATREGQVAFSQRRGDKIISVV